MERHVVGGAVDHAGHDAHRVDDLESGVLGVLDPLRVGGIHLGYNVDLALGVTNEL
jgi:hypothetical protein